MYGIVCMYFGASWLLVNLKWDNIIFQCQNKDEDFFCIIKRIHPVDKCIFKVRYVTVRWIYFWTYYIYISNIRLHNFELPSIRLHNFINACINKKKEDAHVYVKQFFIIVFVFRLAWCVVSYVK